MAFNLDEMATVLRKAGISVVETPGWQTRGYAQQDLIEARGVLWHHTATGRNAFIGNPAPTLSMCINGRSDLAGPLCNILLGRDGVAYIVATGVANHAGTGSGPNIPKDMGNHYLIGIEMESSGVTPWDWTPQQIAAAPRIGLALADHFGFTLQLGHLEYSDAGKIDPAGWPGGMDGLRAAITALDAGKAPSAPAPVKPAPPVVKPTGGTVKPISKGYVPDNHWVVDPGDTLSKIAAYYGEDVSALAEYNGLANPNAINVGEWIWPMEGYTTWSVDPGDTLTSIAAWCQANLNGGITVDSICNANGINDRNNIRVGQRLQIK